MRSLLGIVAGVKNLLALLCLLASACASSTKVEAIEPPPLEEPFRVLILGDSISIGYTPHVRRMLAGRAVVVRPTNAKGGAANCEGANFGVQHVDEWLALEGGAWDVIHFNFGLHDLKRVQPDTGKNSLEPTDPHQADPARYEEQLRTITDACAATGARLVFATTTPVPAGGVRPHRDPQDPVTYNAVARRVMEEKGVPVNDLFTFAAERLEGIQRPVDVHFTKEGSALLADRVVAALLDVAGLP